MPKKSAEDAVCTEKMRSKRFLYLIVSINAAAYLPESVSFGEVLSTWINYTSSTTD